MRESESHRPQLRRLGDILGGIYTPVALVVATAAWMLSGDPTRFLSVLVIATPCPLLIAIPVAIMGSISLCARRAIIVKSPVVLVLVASLERYSKHPLARAILAAATEAGLTLLGATDVAEQPGHGLHGQVNGRQLFVTSRQQLLAEPIAGSEQLPAAASGLECVIVVDGQYAAAYRFRDAPRAESKSFISHLSPKHRFARVMIVSGDRDAEVRYLASQVGVSDVFSQQSPEEKLALVRKETLVAKILCTSVMASTMRRR